MTDKLRHSDKNLNKSSVLKEFKMKIFIVFSLHHCPHLAHGSEYGSIRLHQLLWRIQLRNNTILENQHSVIVQHSVETVGDCDNCAEIQRF